MNSENYEKIGHGIGDSLLSLVGLPADSQVLVIGAGLKRWAGCFMCGHFWIDPDHGEFFAGKYDLVLYHSGCASSRKIFTKQLKNLKILVKDRGSIIVFCKNFFSFSTLQKVKKGEWRQLYKQVRLGYSGFQRAIRRAGIYCRHEFLALPSLENSEEFVMPGSRFLEIPHYLHPLYHVALKFGGFRLVTDGSVFLISPRFIQDEILMKTVARQIAIAERSGSIDILLERFDIRLRGSMVLFLREKRRKQNYVARVVSANYAINIIRRNYTFLKTLRSNKMLERMLGAQLPRPVCEFSCAGFAFFVETLISGQLAWKVNPSNLRDSIFREASRFSYQLQCATRSLSYIGDETLMDLFDNDVERFDFCKITAPYFYEKILEYIYKIKRALSGKRLFLSVSHGDYGYGNILVDPRTGGITGVIDWDTGRGKDLPGIDFLNMLIQKNRNEKGLGLFEAIVEVTSTVLNNGVLDANMSWEKELYITTDILPVLVYATFLRYMSRAAQYTEVFRSELKDYMRTMKYLQENVPL